MQRFGVEQSSEDSVVEGPRGENLPGAAPASREEPVSALTGPSQEHDDLRAEVRRLEVELERYREHAERTSKLFLSATNYAEWVRNNARRDAELALRKARSKVDKLEDSARALERTELELASQRDELARLQALTDATRARLSAFVTAGLQVLDADTEGGRADGRNPALHELQDTLQEQLPSSSVPAPEQLAGFERSER